MTTETTLEHDDDLPSATYRVFPTAINHRNTYDSESNVRKAVGNRLADSWARDKIKVYRAVAVWEDVTDQYVKP